MHDSSDAVTQVLAADADGIAQVVRRLTEGGIAAVPTETVYGLAADAAQDRAVAAVFAAKGRPAFNPLIVHVADRAMAGRYARFSPLAERLAAALWPGPLTLVLPQVPGAPLAGLVTAGLPTVALRVPAHAAMQAVIAGLGRGVAAPSANASGGLSPTMAAHVAAGIGGLVLDAGPCACGLESSVVAVDGERAVLLRPGALAIERIAEVAGQPIAVAAEGAAVAAPGMLLRHYAPRAALRLDARTALPGEFHIGFGGVAGDISLSAGGDLVEAAARLFAALHEADSRGAAAIAVAPVPEVGLGVAINDRLRRGAR